MDDLISRQAAIDGLDGHYIERITLNDWQAGWNAALDWVGEIYLDELPSAQPEIIRCKECTNNRNCDIQYHAQAGDEFWCAAAERRTDEPER